jgi:hypothetical protein
MPTTTPAFKTCGMTASFILAPTLPYARAIMEIMKEYFMLQ